MLLRGVCNWELLNDQLRQMGGCLGYYELWSVTLICYDLYLEVASRSTHICCACARESYGIPSPAAMPWACCHLQRNVLLACL